MRMLLIVLSTLGWMADARAAAGLLDFCGVEAHCRATADGELEQIRGGFVTDTRLGRLQVGIGITRAVAVNDRLVAISHIVLPDVAQIVAAARSAADRALAQNAVLAALNAGAGAVQGTSTAPPPVQLLVNDMPLSGAGPIVVPDTAAIVVQNGPGNIAVAPASFNASSVPTVVQNTLNDQVLRTLTLIQASVNSLSAINAITLADMLRRATAASGR